MKTIALFCVLNLCVTQTQAQVPDAPHCIKVTAFFSEDPQNQQLEQEIITVLEQQLDL